MTQQTESIPIMADDIADLRRDLQRVLESQARLEALIQSEAQRCPYRELMARIEPNTQRITNLEERLTDVRLDIVRMGVASGGTSTGIVALLFGIGKAVGWW